MTNDPVGSLIRRNRAATLNYLLLIAERVDLLEERRSIRHHTHGLLRDIAVSARMFCDACPPA